MDEQITKNQSNKKLEASAWHKPPPKSDNPLDDMLGELTDDLAQRVSFIIESFFEIEIVIAMLRYSLKEIKGIHAKSKGECPTCNRAVIGEAIAALGRVWHPEHFVCCVDDKEIGQVLFALT